VWAHVRALLARARRVLLPPPALSFVLPLPVGPVSVPEGLEVRELPRDEVPQRLAESLAAIDAVAPRGWRCFAVLEAGRIVHSAFVQPTPTGPLLFRTVTVKERRGQGLFRLAARSVAFQLSQEGALVLRSSCARGNRASIRAHRAAGFVG
jgi:hypothetical protein